MLGNFYTIAPAVDNGENDPEKLQVLLSPIVAMVLAKKSLSSMFTEGLPLHDPHVPVIEDKIDKNIVPKMNTLSEKMPRCRRRKSTRA